MYDIRREYTSSGRQWLKKKIFINNVQQTTDTYTVRQAFTKDMSVDRPGRLGGRMETINVMLRENLRKADFRIYSNTNCVGSQRACKLYVCNKPRGWKMYGTSATQPFTCYAMLTERVQINSIFIMQHFSQNQTSLTSSWHRRNKPTPNVIILYCNQHVTCTILSQARHINRNQPQQR